MFSRALTAGVLGLAILPTLACSVDFSLTWSQDDEYVLAPADGKGRSVYAYLEGGKEMTLEEVVKLNCTHGDYALPVLKTEVETGVSSATILEYFIYRIEGAAYSPIKSMLSVRSTDRQTGELISAHSLLLADEGRDDELCNHIAQENGFDRAIVPAASSD